METDTLQGIPLSGSAWAQTTTEVKLTFFFFDEKIMTPDAKKARHQRETRDARTTDCDPKPKPPVQAATQTRPTRKPTKSTSFGSPWGSFWAASSTF